MSSDLLLLRALRYYSTDEYLTLKTNVQYNFSEVSEKILKKCGGVPLAIVTTSSFLANKLGNINEWNEFCDSIGSGLEGDHDMVSMRKILSLSYHDLPSHLKACLLYVSTFPEDYEIGKDRLIWRWIAEEFVQHREGGQTLFDLGQSYFNELLNRSLIQPASIVDENTPLACRVHDMVLDLICSLSREENFAATILGESETRQNTFSSGSNVRRLSLHSTTWPTVNTSKLRSLTVFIPDIIMSMPSPTCYHLLRVLDLQDCSFTGKRSLPFVGYLIHLRYLGLRYSRYDGELPVEIQKLQFLQTLNIEGAYIKELPASTAELRQLMSLYVEPSTRLPNRLRNLTLLEVLTVAGVDSASTADELGHLTKLRKLGVHLQMDEGRLDEDMGKALVESLGKMHKLQDLFISFGVASNLEGSVEALGNLRRLFIYSGSSMPKWINPASLLWLSIVQMTVTQVRMEDIQVLGALLALRFLRLDMTGSVDIQVDQRFTVSADAFPCIRVCKLLRFTTVPSIFPRGSMPKLEQFEFRIRLKDFSTCELDEDLALGHLPTLKRVYVDLYGKRDVSEGVAQKVEKKLRHETNVHPNHPFICIRS